MIDNVELNPENIITYYNYIVHSSIYYEKLNPSQKEFISSNFLNFDASDKKIVIWKFIKIIQRFLYSEKITKEAITFTNNNIEKILLYLDFKKLIINDEVYWTKPDWMIDEDFWL